MVHYNGGALKEALEAERLFLGQAVNVEVKLPWYRKVTTYHISNHSYMHSNIKIWNKYIKPIIGR